MAHKDGPILFTIVFL